MLLSENVLFIHVPKTGGMAMTNYLTQVLRGPTIYTAPEPDPALHGDSRVQYVPGTRHETLEEAQAILAALGHDISGFSAILAGVRNPYALEVSRYAYLQTGHAVDAGPEQDLAMSSDFPTFVLKSDRSLSAPIHEYYTAGGVVPANLRVIRLEHVDEDISRILADLGLPSLGSVVKDNQSLHDDYRSYYDRRSEQEVYERYRWIFDQGWYDRIDLSHGPAGSDPGGAPSGTRSEAHKVPVHGCVGQVGPTSGAYSDGWIGAELRFRVAGTDRADYLTVEAFLPEGRAQDLTLQIGADTFVGRFGAGPVTWTVPCLIPPSSPTLVTLTPSCTWVPADLIDGSPDTRTLSLILSRLTFSRATPGPAAVDPVDADWLDDLPSTVGS